MDQPQLIKGAEAWAAEGDETGVLVIHGFTGSPQSVRPWAEAIHAKGRTVIVPRLPGHGTSVQDLANYGPRDWVNTAEEGLRGLIDRCDRIFVCGLSMGGTITYDLASRFKDQIAGIVVVNGPVFSKDPRAKLAPLLGKVNLSLKGVANDIAEPGQHEIAYGKVSTRAAAKLLTYMGEVQRGLGRISCPALVFTSAQDHVVHPSNGPYIVDHISSTDKRHEVLERSFHVATLDYDRQHIFDETIAFIDSH